jgi:predicted nuclease of predicted toxin-antitoxin system
VKLLFDQNLSHKLPARLGDLFPGSSQVRLLGLERADDRTIWRWAGENDFVIVTYDSDFAEMVALHGSPPKVVWLRCGNRPTDYVADLLRRRSARLLAMADGDEDCLEIA